MIKYNIILVFYFGITFDFFYVVHGVQKREGIECDNVCYQGVIEELKRLNDLYNKSPSISNIPSTLDDINELINKTENIVLNIKNLDHVKNKSQSTYDTISHSSRKLELLQNIVDELILINQELSELKRKKDIRNDALNECAQADKLYGSLRDDLENITKIGKDVLTPLDVSRRVDEIKKNNFNIKKKLDDLEIPESLFESYVCNSKLQATIQDIIDSMEEIANMLQTSFEGIMKSKLKDIENNISGNEQNIKDMGKSLEEEIPTTDVKITDETRPTLDELRNKIKDLKNKIKEIKLDKSLEDILENARRQLNDLIKEYKEILNFMFSKQNMEKVKEEIEIATKTLQLLEERDAVKIEVENIKQVVDTLKDRGVCFIEETVSVEDKIIVP